jgi:hypothetical protein
MKEFERMFGYMKIDGKYYKEAEKDGKSILVEISDREIQKKIELSKKIIPKLREHLDRDKILMEALMKKTEANLKKMEEKLFGKEEPISIYTRSHHCIDMKIGGQILEIVPANYL